jgi:DNA/RNA endonuclease G (NUC1)
VIYTPDGGGKAIAFIFPNTTKPGTLAHAVRTVRQLEQVAKLDFLPELPSGDQDEVEKAKADASFWKMDYGDRFKCGAD